MTGVIATIPKFQFNSTTGTPLANGTLTTYLAGTTTLAVTWQNQAQTTANTNPIVLDASGGCVIWLDDAKRYKFVLRDAKGVTQWTTDDINGVTSLDQLLTPSGSSLVGYLSAGTGAVARTAQDKMRESVSVKDFGAVGDGVTDDTAAFNLATAAITNGRWIDGGGLTYRVDGQVLASGTYFKLRNVKFVTTTTYASQGYFTITSPTVMLENIDVDGGRGTYKTGLETWAVFSALFGYSSISPTLPPFFSCTNMTADAIYKVDNVNFYNVFADSCIQITTYGTVEITNAVYKNCANKTFHVYHSPDDGVTQAGRTIASDLYAENIGILPATYLVGGVTKVFADAYAPQGSFNFIVSHGDFVISNAFVWNYGSCGVTADRNINFTSDNVIIMNTTAQALSNNSSGSMWLEDCDTATINNLTLMVTQRDSRELVWDSSMLQLFCTSGSKTMISNLVCIGDGTTARVTKMVRGSVLSNATVFLNNFYLYGRSSIGEAITFNSLPDNIATHEIHITKGFVRNGGIRVERPQYCSIDDVHLYGDTDTGSISFPVSGNTGVTGPTNAISVSDSWVNGAITCTLNVLTSFKITDNKIIAGALSCSASDGTQLVSGNTYIGNSLNLSGISSTSGVVNVLNNAEIVGITSIPFGKNVRVSGNMTRRRVDLGDVQTFEVVGNTLKTDQPEAILRVLPVTAANILAGVISSNNMLVKTGTVGAGFVTIGVGVTGVTDVSNNKLTVAWTN